MNPIKYFKKADLENPHLFDPFENSHIFMQHAQCSVRKNNQIIYQSVVRDVSITYGDHEASPTHLWCCFHIKNGMMLRGDNKIFSEKLWSFGNHILVITDFKKFQERIIKKLKTLNLKFYADSVKYIEKSALVTNMDIFTKFNDYAYQNEYRLAIRASKSFSNDAYKLEIGSIKDISIILHQFEVKNYVEQTFDEIGNLSKMHF